MRNVANQAICNGNISETYLKIGHRKKRNKRLIYHKAISEIYNILAAIFTRTLWKNGVLYHKTV